jgi:dipeptidyl aminopeptidase/acylaminoacyl peptidase
VPPDLFCYDLHTHLLQKITKLNPRFDTALLGQVEHFRWRTSLGNEEVGLLVKPVNFEPGKRYPIVVQTKQIFGDWFLCDTGPYHMPSACPQPLAGAGIMYLVRAATHVMPDHAEATEEFDRHFPGGIGEVEREVDVWESALRELDREGMIDIHRVGVIGFSRGGWYSEFMLEHSGIHFAAATSADNVTYYMSSYWLERNNAVMKGMEQMYGGPPYGPTLRAWLEYSVPFNVERVHTPLLMEEIGGGARDDIPDAIPISLAEHYELFTALNRLGKPVEMYYYPDDVHELSSPAARLASEQRNLDWYRFWLQGYERRNPADRQQYQGWRRLRELQDQDNGT